MAAAGDRIYLVQTDNHANWDFPEENECSMKLSKSVNLCLGLRVVELYIVMTRDEGWRLYCPHRKGKIGWRWFNKRGIEITREDR